MDCRWYCGGLQKEINVLRKNIKDLGNVNVEAIEEYKESKERFDFFIEQIANSSLSAMDNFSYAYFLRELVFRENEQDDVLLNIIRHDPNISAPAEQPLPIEVGVVISASNSKLPIPSFG